MSPLYVQNLGYKINGSICGAAIDEHLYSRYRFTAAEEQPGSASGLSGLAYSHCFYKLDDILVRLCRVLRFQRRGMDIFPGACVRNTQGVEYKCFLPLHMFRCKSIADVQSTPRCQGKPL